MLWSHTCICLHSACSTPKARMQDMVYAAMYVDDHERFEPCCSAAWCGSTEVELRPTRTPKRSHEAGHAGTTLMPCWQTQCLMTARWRRPHEAGCTHAIRSSTRQPCTMTCCRSSSSCASDLVTSALSSERCVMALGQSRYRVSTLLYPASCFILHRIAELQHATSRMHSRFHGGNDRLCS